MLLSSVYMHTDNSGNIPLSRQQANLSLALRAVQVKPNKIVVFHLIRSREWCWWTWFSLIASLMIGLCYYRDFIFIHIVMQIAYSLSADIILNTKSDATFHAYCQTDLGNWISVELQGIKHGYWNTEPSIVYERWTDGQVHLTMLHN